MSEQASPSPASASSAAPDARQSATGRNNTISGQPPVGDIRSSINGLPPKQVAAMELMLRGVSDAEVGQQLGIERGTVYRWRTKPGPFRKRLARYRKEIWKQQADMRGMVQPALEVLQAQLANTTDPRIALRAASILLRFAAPGRKALDELENQPTPQQRAAAHNEATWQKIKAQNDGPLPGESPR